MKTPDFATSVALKELRDAAHPLSGGPGDWDALLQRIGDARFVLLGEATHGTHEFYRARAEITKRLILEKGFTVIAWEADWPDALRLNRFIKAASQDKTPLEALGDFQRFPRWMWRNTEILELVRWLRGHNDSLNSRARKAGVYGLDLYSLHRSMAAVIEYLENVDPEAAEEARQRYACFEDFGDDPQSYGATAHVHKSLSCEEEVVAQLVELQRHTAEYLQRDGEVAEDELFFAEQNARVALNAEKYYRAMYRGRPNTWNLRDTHMVDTLDALIEHMRVQGHSGKAVIWAHNSHLGDARATQMSRRDEINVGQLMRERHHADSVLVGFSTYTGTVTAASGWDRDAERKRVRLGMEGSCEAFLHEVDLRNFYLMCGESAVRRHLEKRLLERAIGVIYLPETERYSHYFFASVAQQFDVVIHYDETRALEPLDMNAGWEEGELPETYPFGV